MPKFGLLIHASDDLKTLQTKDPNKLFLNNLQMESKSLFLNARKYILITFIKYLRHAAIF